MRQIIPWWARILAKMLLSRLPVSYCAWRRLNLFSHGAMNHAEYALDVFHEHFSRGRLGPGYVALELGPGDSLAAAIIAKAHGAARTYLIDVGEYATTDLSFYKDLVQDLHRRGLKPPSLMGVTDVDSLLRLCDATYATDGLTSLCRIPDHSVDFIWSHAVLEHIRRNDFPKFVAEMRRVLRPGGFCSHRIDLKDHLGGKLNNLRIPSAWWEMEWVARSGFYTNRLRKSEMVRMFENARFAVDVVSTACWDSVPTPIARFAREFRGLDIDDLQCCGFTVVLRPS